MDSELQFVYVTYPSEEEAISTARFVIEKKLCVCANISTARKSIYPWKGRIEEASEFTVLFKTLSPTLDSLKEHLAKMHSYDTPIVACWPAQSTSSEYLKWAESELSTSI